MGKVRNGIFFVMFSELSYIEGKSNSFFSNMIFAQISNGRIIETDFFCCKFWVESFFVKDVLLCKGWFSWVAHVLWCLLSPLPQDVPHFLPSYHRPYCCLRPSLFIPGLGVSPDTELLDAGICVDRLREGRAGKVNTPVAGFWSWLYSHLLCDFKYMSLRA